MEITPKPSTPTVTLFAHQQTRTLYSPLRWAIPLIIPALVLLVYWDLRFPLSAHSASDHVLSLLHQDMLIEDAFTVMLDNGYDPSIRGTSLEIERHGRASTLAALALKISDEMPHFPLKYKLNRLARQGGATQRMYISSTSAEPIRLHLRYVLRFGNQY